MDENTNHPPRNLGTLGSIPITSSRNQGFEAFEWSNFATHRCVSNCVSTRGKLDRTDRFVWTAQGRILGDSDVRVYTGGSTNKSYIKDTILCALSTL